MNETCDRCGPSVSAAYRVRRSGELFLCGHCTNSLWLDLLAEGWSILRAHGPTLVYREVDRARRPKSRLKWRAPTGNRANLTGTVSCWRRAARWAPHLGAPCGFPYAS
jgi:ribosomal protein S27AE